MKLISLLTSIILCVLMSACTPSVQVKAPDKPIAIAIDVNVKHKFEVDRKVDKAMADKKDIF